MEPAEPGPREPYRVTCHSCHGEYDAAAATFCRCLAAERTLVCRVCGSCFCKAPRSYKLEFWSGAPKWLWDAKLAERRARTALPENPFPATARRPLILLCEDEEDIARIAIAAIEELGYGCVYARTGTDGLALAQKFRPDAILTDALMPGMDGRELCRRLKADPRTSEIRIAIMTSLYTSQKYRSEALDLGADEYLSKPLDFARLAEVLHKLAPPREGQGGDGGPS